MILSPSPKLAFLNNNGRPLVGGKLFTYAAGTINKIATYQNEGGSQNTNPILLDFRGEANVWLDAQLAYKYVLSLPNDTDPPTNPIYTVDDIRPLGGPDDIGRILYPQTPAETATGAVIVNWQYPPYTPDRYGTNTSPGATDMFDAIQMADEAASEAGAAVSFIPGEIYGVNCSAHASNLVITAHWVCNGPAATIQRIDFSTQTAYFTARADDQNNLMIRGLIWDGQVTATSAGSTPNVDIGAIGSFNDDVSEALWSKSYGLRLYNCQNCTVQDCLFVNFLRAGLRVDSDGIATGPNPAWAQTIALGNKVINCKTRRTRGYFGDAFYFAAHEGLFVSDCYAYDYQRIAYVQELSTLGLAQANSQDPQYINCIGDFGHDAVAPESNVGFWCESADGVGYVNCVGKNSAIGWVLNAVPATNAEGVYRPFTASQSLVGCRGIANNHDGIRALYASRGCHLSITSSFFEVRSNAAPYAYSVGGAPAGITVGFVEDVNLRSVHADIQSVGIDMVGWSGNTQAAAISIPQGFVTNPYQFQLNLEKVATRWLTTAGARDTAAQTQYESTTAPNYGYFGDIVFSGLNNQVADYRFKGRARISGCTNETFGYVMFSSEIVGTNAVLELEDMRISMRTGGATANVGKLILADCAAVDMRGQLGWTRVLASNCEFEDLGFASNRTAWQPGEMKLSNCFFTRQLYMDFNGNGGSANRPLRLTATNCEWFLPFNNESGLKIDCATASSFIAAQWSNCTWRNNGTGVMGATKSMIECNFASTITLQVSGAGNAYDNAMVGGGGHVMQTNTTPAYNDAPQTIAGPWLSVNGVLQQFGPV